MAQSARFNMEIAANVKGANNIRRLGNSMQGVQGKVKNLTMSMGALNNAFRIFAGIIAAGAFTRFIKSAIDQADAFGKLSRQTGIAADTLQSYVNAGKLAGVEQATIEKGLRRLAQSMREADQGVATYSDAYQALGITVRDSNGDLKKTEDLLAELADKFKGMKNGSTKAALAMEIFGRSGAKLIPMLNEGGDALKEWNYQTSSSFSQNAEYFNDQLTIIGFGFDRINKQLTDELLPSLNSMAEAWRKFTSGENDWGAFTRVSKWAIRGIAFLLLSTATLAEELIVLIDAAIRQFAKLATLDFKGVKRINEEYKQGIADRFERNKETFRKIFEESTTPESYFKEGNNSAEEFLSTMKQIQTTMKESFGKTMNAKLLSFSKSLNDFGSLVGDTIVKAFKGLEDTLVNFVTTGKLQFKSLVQSIIADLARLTIRRGITQPLFNAFSSALGGALSGSLSGGGMSAKGYFDPVTGLGTAGPNFGLPAKLATGGFISQPTRALVGESGSEYVIRADQMDQAMRRYAKGARGQSVIDGVGGSEDESGHLVGAGAIDVRFDVQRINAVDYVTAQQFEQGIRSATEQGARKGEQMTLRRLQTSPNTRKRIGV